MRVSNISDQELVSTIKRLSTKERELTHEIILHLAELDRRRLYADLGYCSMYDYATRGLGYASASAQRRVKAARAVRLIPEVYECLKNGSLSLGVLEVIADFLTGPDAREILLEVCGKTKDEAMRIVASYYPVDQKKLSDKIEPVVVTSAKSRASLTNSQRTFFYISPNPDNFTSLRAEACNFTGNGDEETEEVEEQFRISFTVGSEFREKLNRVKELMPGNLAVADLETVFERLLDEHIERHCPQIRNQKRVQRRKEKAERKLKQQGEKILDSLDLVQEAAEEIIATMPEKEKDPRDRRFVSKALREEILARDEHRCTFVAPDGTRCEARTALEIDHIIPWSLGGRTEPANLRTTCRAHNLLYARKCYGDEHVEKMIELRRATGRTHQECNPFFPY